jgi:hypothetical protein
MTSTTTSICRLRPTAAPRSTGLSRRMGAGPVMLQANRHVRISCRCGSASTIASRRKISHLYTVRTWGLIHLQRRARGWTVPAGPSPTGMSSGLFCWLLPTFQTSTAAGQTIILGRDLVMALRLCRAVGRMSRRFPVS